MDFPKYNLEVLINENKQWYLISKGENKVLVEDLPKENCVVYWRGDFVSYIEKEVSNQAKIGLHQCLLSDESLKGVPPKEFVKKVFGMNEFLSRNISVPIEELKVKNGYGCDFSLSAVDTDHLLNLLNH